MRYFRLFIVIVITLVTNLVYAGYSSPESIFTVAWSSDGQKIAISYINSIFQVQDTSNGEILFQEVAYDIIRNISWSPSGSKITYSGYDGAVHIKDTTTWQTILVIDGYGDPSAVLWHPDETIIYTTNSAINQSITIRMWDALTGELLAENYVGEIANPQLYNNIIIANNLDSLVLIEASTLDIIDILSCISYEDTGYFATIVKNSPDDNLVAMGHTNGTVCVWDWQTKTLVAQVDAGAGYITDIVFNLNSSRLSTIMDSGIQRSWNTTTWQMITDEMYENFEYGRFNSIGNILAVSTSSNLQLEFEFICDITTQILDLNIINQANSVNIPYTICLTENATYTLTAPLPTITGDITVIGNGAQLVMTGTGRVFDVASTGGLTLKNITVSGGNAVQGGAIYNAGALVLEDVVLENNSATDGGAIYNVGSLTMDGGAIQNNTATNLGGGIYTVGDTLDLDGVNIRDNDAVEGSGVYQGE